MFAIDFQPFDPQVSGVGATASVAISDVAQLHSRKPNFVIYDCRQIESGSEPTSAERGIDPASLISTMAGTPQHSIPSNQVKVQLLKGPAHGALRSESSDTGYRYYIYDPTPGYIGRDLVVFLGSVGGKTYKIFATVAVVLRSDERPDQTVCPPSEIRHARDTAGASRFTMTAQYLSPHPR